MPYELIADPASEVEIAPGANASKRILDNKGLRAVIFAMDSGQGVPDHQVADAAIVQVLTGLLHYTVEGEAFDLAPGSWLYLAPETPHALEAAVPTVLLLTMAKPHED